MFVSQQQRRDTAANWTSANPVLLAGEIGLETDTDLFKFGNGVSTWTSLPYANPTATGTVTSVFGRTGTVTAVSGDYTVSQVSGAAPLASPALTGTPTAPTATAGTNTTQIATTAFVGAAIPATLPPSGTAPSEVSPKVVTLTDAATILVNAQLGNEMRVTLGGNRTMGAPTNATDGETITFELVQDATGTRTITWASGTSGYSFGSGSAPTLSTAAHAVDFVAFRYSAAAGNSAGAWCYLGVGLGF